MYHERVMSGRRNNSNTPNNFLQMLHSLAPAGTNKLWMSHVLAIPETEKLVMYQVLAIPETEELEMTHVLAILKSPRRKNLGYLTSWRLPPPHPYQGQGHGTLYGIRALPILWIRAKMKTMILNE